MADTINNGQTCLEKQGITARKDQTLRSDYTKNDEYSSVHQDSISNGDVQGKGHPTVKGHTHWTPSCDGTANNMIKYDNFATSPEDQIGGEYDIKGRNGIDGREGQLARSLYNYKAPYGTTSVDTTANVNDGQYYFGQQIGSKTA